MGRGSATIRVKIKNVRRGTTTEKTFVNGAKVNDVQIFKKDLRYLYKDSDFAYLMNLETFEQVSLALDKFPEHVFLKDGMNFNISFLREEPLALNIPPKMEFKVTDTGPSLRGNSATNIYKDAVLDNGLKTKVPLFINIGDSVRIDTRTGVYSEKA